MKNLFNIKKAIKSLPHDTITIPWLLGLIIMIVFTSIISLFEYDNFFLSTIKNVFIEFEDISNSDKLILYLFLPVMALLGTLMTSIISVLIIVFINWRVKIALRESVTFYKLLNISVYALCIGSLIELIISVFIIILFPLFNLTSADNIGIMIYFSIAVSHIVAISLYFYGIALARNST